jgi:hypothetical protein
MTRTAIGSQLHLEAVGPERPAGDGDAQAVLLALTTEHFTLQTARAVTVSDSNGRTALYLGSLSSSLVALALVAQQLRFGDVFLVFVLTVLPALLFLGLVTYVRVLHNSVEDIIYARAINRIRHYYTELDPAKAHYFLLSGRDDVRGALQNMYLRDSWTQFLFTLPSAVAVINGLLAGTTVALALAFTVGAVPLLAMVAGAGVGSAVLALHVAYQVHHFSRMKTTVEALFPSRSPADRPSRPGPVAGPLQPSA